MPRFGLLEVKQSDNIQTKNKKSEKTIEMYFLNMGPLHLVIVVKQSGISKCSMFAMMQLINPSSCHFLNAVDPEDWEFCIFIVSHSNDLKEC